MPIIVLGAYVAREYAVDIIFIGITSLLGLCLKRFGFSAPAIVLGFVLGNLLERTLLRSIDLHGVALFWSSPTAMVLTVIILIAIFWGPMQSLMGRIRGKKAAGEGQA